MELIAQQILNLLITPPGNLIYFLVITFSIMTAFQVVLAARVVSQGEEINRTLIGLSLLIAGQLALLISSGLVWQNIVPTNTFLPPLERAVTVLSVVWIIWIWNYAQPNRMADVLVVLMSLAVSILFLFTLSAIHQQPAGQGFNNTWFDWGWQILLMATCLIGILILMLRRPNEWGIGFGFMLLILSGALAHLLLLKSAGDYAPAVRLAQLCAFPLLPSITQHLLKQPPEKKEPSRIFEPEKRKHTADPRAVHAWLQLTVQPDPDHLCVNLTRAVAQTMLADMCYLVSISKDSADILLVGGFDLIREESLTGCVLDKEKIPAISGAIHRGRPLRVSANLQNNPELLVLGEAIGLKTPGSLLYIPLAASSQDIWGGLLMLSPYSNRVWSAEDQTYLFTVTESIVRLLRKAEKQQITRSDQHSEDLSEQYIALKDRLAELEDQNRQLSQTQNPSEALQKVEALLALQKEAQEQINQLQEENSGLNQKLQGSETGDSEQLENDLRLALQEVAHLQNELAGANMKILTLDIQSKNNPYKDMESIVDLVQDLRQPMASIVGYTEILMSESIGILGNLQRKFLSRIQIAITRMETLLNTLAQNLSYEKTVMENSPEPVNLTGIIDNAIDEISAGIREKQISLHVDLPPKLPEINADTDALQQIIVGLLQNAEDVTPQGETMRLRVSVERDNELHPYLLIQITDSGGGVRSQDLPNIFTTPYLSNNAKIQGLSENGIGLAIVKTLTEAHGGRIWVESSLLKTTISVLIPNYHGTDISVEVGS